MRVSTLAGVAVAALCFGSCGAQPEAGFDPGAAVTAMSERAWSRGDVTVLDSLMADSIRFHYNGAPARTMSRERMADGILAWREAFPDLRMETLELVADGNRVASRLRITGTHRGPWWGADPTGAETELALMVFFRFEDGRVVEMWEVDDQLGFRQQLGLPMP